MTTTRSGASPLYTHDRILGPVLTAHASQPPRLVALAVTCRALDAGITRLWLRSRGGQRLANVTATPRAFQPVLTAARRKVASASSLPARRAECGDGSASRRLSPCPCACFGSREPASAGHGSSRAHGRRVGNPRLDSGLRMEHGAGVCPLARRRNGCRSKGGPECPQCCGRMRLAARRHEASRGFSKVPTPLAAHPSAGSDRGWRGLGGPVGRRGRPLARQNGSAGDRDYQEGPRWTRVSKGDTENRIR